MLSSLGVYISVPFCRAKCTFCNFASDAFAADRIPLYVSRLCEEIRSSRSTAANLQATLPALVNLPELVDTVYFGGGTPSLLAPEQMRQIFESLRAAFNLSADAEITLECAPGQLAQPTLDELLRQGMNRISFGVQSFVDAEAAAVGRLHTARQCLDEVARLRAAGVPEINLDLIAGLPHQTESSWSHSLAQAVASGAPHLSVYMLEIDDDSRLGREALAHGSRYHAATLPPDDAVADWYQGACDAFSQAGIAQYEISNFARPGHQSKHNLKYWQRLPYLGFGLDAHSMLETSAGAVRFANPGDLNAYLAPPGNRSLSLYSPPSQPEPIGTEQALEESLFLGLRLNSGVDLRALRRLFGDNLMHSILSALEDVQDAGLLARHEDRIRLTAKGRLASNEVFSRLLLPTAA